MDDLARTSDAPAGALVAPAALWRRWVLLVGLGELIGFAAPGVMGVWAQNRSTGSQVTLLVVGGMLEGAALGVAQALVLRRVLPGFRVNAWVGATAGAAGFAWLLGMLPSATHSSWSSWPPAWIVLGGVVLGLLLLASIGTAQALVLPPGTAKPFVWVGWTALGWCAGLAAFTVVAPPLWQEGQPRWQLVAIGLAGGAVMAFTMAAVTGLGVVRFRCRPVGPGDDTDSLTGARTLSSVVGTPVFTPRGDAVGTVRDLVVDLDDDQGRFPVTGVVVERRGGSDLMVAWGHLTERPGLSGLILTDQDPAAGWAPRPTQVCAHRDILDAPVVLVDRPRRARVSEVVLELSPDRAWVTGLDTRPSRALRRLWGQAPADVTPESVPVTHAHFTSQITHSAQLAAPHALVSRLTPQEMAEVVTRVSVTHAREILAAADRHVARTTLSLLHPTVRARLTGADGVPRRTRRFAGWLLHRPVHRRGPGPGPRT